MIVMMGSAISIGAVAKAPSLARADERVRRLVVEHIDSIARALRRLGVPQSDVDDAVQQVFLTMSRRLAEIEPHAEKAFLYKTAVHVAAHARRTVSRRRESGEDEALTRTDDSISAEEFIDRRRAAELLEQVLDAMPSDLRVAFVLYEVEQLPVAEIASMLEIPVGTAASRLRRAREDFQERVARLRLRMGGSP